MTQTSPIEATPAPLPAFVGAVDRLFDGVMSGWAVTIEGDPCEVTVRVDGETVATIRSEGARSDLLAKRQSRGAGGWAAKLGARAHSGAVIEALLPDGTHLAGSPLIADSGGNPPAPEAREAPPPELDAPITYVGAIDLAEGEAIFGWAISSRFEPAPVTIQVNGHPAETIESANDRADLIAQNLTSSGGGWHFRVAQLLRDGHNLISVTFPDGSHLPGSPIKRWIGDGTPPPEEAEPEPVPAPRAVPEPPAKPAVPSLVELDELNLDDLSLAVAAGLINVAPPPSEPEVVEEPEPETPVEAPVAPEPRRGFLAKLFGR